MDRAVENRGINWGWMRGQSGKAFSAAAIEQYCHCYANGMADRLSDDDLKALAAMERSARAGKIQPIIEAASAPCLEALPKAN